MVRPIYIPPQIKDAIAKHLQEAITKGIKGYESAFEDEDVLTGHLFGLMKIDEQSVFIDNVEIGGTWKWSIDYKKFGGRGKGATESIIGADGIFELSLNRNNEVYNKSLLFQSKLDWRTKDEKLYFQSAKLMTWHGAATIINYTQEQIETYMVDDVLATQGRRPPVMTPLDRLLGDNFINCHIGDSDLKYDAFTKKLIWVDNNNETVAINFNVNRRLKIKVKAPSKFPYQEREISRLITADELTLHQLNTTLANYDINNAYTLKELRKLQSKISMMFHPDRHPALPEMQVNLFSEMMKYYNNEIDKRKEFLKKYKK